MPKTKFQDIIFTIMMVFAMVYIIVVFNIALEMGNLKYVIFHQAFLSMWPIFIIAFILKEVLAGPLSKKLAFRVVSHKDKPIFIILAISSFTVCLMAPMMSLFATILYHGFIAEVPLLWLTAFVKNFLFALCLQIFFIGPLVRLIFRNLFIKQLAQ